MLQRAENRFISRVISLKDFSQKVSSLGITFLLTSRDINGSVIINALKNYLAQTIEFALPLSSSHTQIIT